MHALQHQHAALSLLDGIAEYRRANPTLAHGRALSPPAREFFRCHDAAHVVFGCDTGLHDEMVVKIASLFGTTAGFALLRGYRLHESIEVYKRLRVLDVLGAITQSVVVVPRSVLRCIRQRRRWPWSDFDAYAHVPLARIREQFGIRVAHAAA